MACRRRGTGGRSRSEVLPARGGLRWRPSHGSRLRCGEFGRSGDLLSFCRWICFGLTRDRTAIFFSNSSLSRSASAHDMSSVPPKGLWLSSPSTAPSSAVLYQSRSKAAASSSKTPGSGPSNSERGREGVPSRNNRGVDALELGPEWPADRWSLRRCWKRGLMARWPSSPAEVGERR